MKFRASDTSLKSFDARLNVQSGGERMPLLQRGDVSERDLILSIVDENTCPCHQGGRLELPRTPTKSADISTVPFAHCL